ncbi:unnamed protein product, partial [Brassica rapa]|uniref:DUF4283 domain-containing protein n=1 Tax=Brassica campestris TaxID=3711 RepID=A0A3P5ZQ84_BRACM
MVKKKSKVISLADLPEIDVAASGSSIQGTVLASLASLAENSEILASRSLFPVRSDQFSDLGSSLGYGPNPVETKPPVTQFSSSPPPLEVCPQSVGAASAQPGSNSGNGDTPAKNYADLLKSSAQLQELGSPIEHVSGAPFVLIPDENIEAAKLEIKDFIYARFHGDYPTMGKIIGVVNAIWAKTGPKIFIHNIGQGIYLLRVTNQRTREVLLSRTCWNIAGLPMFVAPWSPDYSPDEPPLTSAIVPVEMRNVPYLLFNKESLSRLATAIGKPDSLAPETERKLNFEVAKLYVRVDLTSPLPTKIVSGFSNGKEVMIDVSYPWLPVKCDRCNKFGHTAIKCSMGVAEGAFASRSVRQSTTETSRRRSRSRPSRSTVKKVKQGTLQYVPVVKNSHEVPKNSDSMEALVNSTYGDQEKSPSEEYDTESEEGEIYQQVLEVFTVSQQSTDGTLAEQKNPASDDLIVGSEVRAVGLDSGAVGVVLVSSTAAVVSLDSSTENSVPASLNLLLHSQDAAVEVHDTGEVIAGLGSALEVSVNDTEDIPNANGGKKAPDIEVTEYAPEQEQEEPYILVKNRRTIPRGWNFFGNYEDDDSGRIVLVRDPRVILVIYEATAQSVTCGVSVLSENISLTVTFVYGFNQVEDRRCLWHNLVNLQTTSPVSYSPWSDANIGLQDAQLFEAQAKGLPFTWRNSQDNNPISTRIDHAFINQAWLTSFPDSYADFLDPSQSDHAPCLFRMPSIRRQVVKSFKFFHHVIDPPEYADTVRQAWNYAQITGTDQFKLVRSLKLLKRPLRLLNKRHFSGISQRVKAQKERVDVLQRSLLTTPDIPTAREEHIQRDKLNVLLKAEEKFYKQRSRVRWAGVGDRNTPFYHRTVSSHASRNHIHYLKDSDDRLYYSIDEIKSHAADYFQGILGSTDLPFSPASSEELRSLLPFR